MAILDLEARGISLMEALTLTDRFRTAIGQTEAVRLVERSLMREILMEQDFQLTGCTSDECAVEVGQLLGVKYMMGGSIGKVGEAYTIDVRMVSVETGGIEITKEITYIGEVAGLITETEILAYDIMGLDPPPDLLERRRLGTKAFLEEQAGRAATRSGGLLRSMAFPGLGQLYYGRKVSGYGLLAAGLAVTGVLLAEYGSYQTAYDDYNRYLDLYRLEEDYPEILEYKNNARASHDKLDRASETINILAPVAAGLWAANVLHALLVGPKRRPQNAYSELPAFRLVSDPRTHQTHLRWEIALD
ncbi:MAG: hypothetical protein IH971_11065 [Candidatus Marinimicrobia bacterium]|nr:hypothetical protein [Candidatus Neomarinimicrobiota bacterium]